MSDEMKDILRIKKLAAQAIGQSRELVRVREEASDKVLETIDLIDKEFDGDDLGDQVFDHLQFIIDNEFDVESINNTEMAIKAEIDDILEELEEDDE